MCGRYYIDIDIDDKELKNAFSEVERNLSKHSEAVKTSGEIYPTNVVPVQTGMGKYQAMKWGFAGFDGRPIINARSETASSKPMFQQPMLAGRCLIPASGYYEWQKNGKSKTKYQLFIHGQPMYLAGCYRNEKDSAISSFVILTRPATGDLSAIHERMPVIIPQNRMSDWLHKITDPMELAVSELRYEQASSALI